MLELGIVRVSFTAKSTSLILTFAYSTVPKSLDTVAAHSCSRAWRRVAMLRLQVLFVVFTCFHCL